MIRRTNHGFKSTITGIFLMHELASASLSKISYKVRRRFWMGATRSILFLFQLLLSWLIILLTLRKLVYFYCLLVFRHGEKNSNLHPTEEGGDNGTWIDRSSYILLRNHGKYGKYYDKKMRDCVIMRVLERGRLMP